MPDQPGGEPAGVLPVSAVVELLHEWVELDARHRPGFAGAYLWGGITALPPDAPFALYRDVDIVVVQREAGDDSEEEVLFHGLMLEVITHSLDAHRDAEAVLANPSMAPNIAATQILADPTGMLAPLQARVRAEYAEPRWIRARCEREKADALEHLSAMRTASTPYDRVNSVWLVLYALSGLLAVALLRRPTTRRTLSLLGELLLEQGRPDLQEAALTLWGSAAMDRAEVEAILARTAAAFDRAVEVYRTPFPFGFTLRPFLRPYYVEAAQEMIEQGQHREAMFWIMATAGESYIALANDAPEAEKPVYADELRALHRALGYTTPEAYARKVEQAERLIRDVFGVADGVIAAEQAPPPPKK